MAILGSGGLNARFARLLTAVLLVGGMVAGPVVHLLPPSADRSPVAAAGAHDHDAPDLPNTHDHCAICVVLGTVAPPAVPDAVVVPAAPGVLPSVAATVPVDATLSDSRRARAPPLG
jgi:hypothetical protein